MKLLFSERNEMNKKMWRNPEKNNKINDKEKQELVKWWGKFECWGMASDNPPSFSRFFSFLWCTQPVTLIERYPICELLEGIGSELKHINEVGFVKMKKQKKMKISILRWQWEITRNGREVELSMKRLFGIEKP